MEEIRARDTLGDSALGTIAGHNRQQSGARGTVWAIVPWRKCLGHNRRAQSPAASGCFSSKPKWFLEDFGLRIQVVFKRARWVKSRFSLNLASLRLGIVSLMGFLDNSPVLVARLRALLGPYAYYLDYLMHWES
ncbi:hypothetical protein L6452_05694 [Arctium lappa]|uniref:Uncharacterized protein n=1 Tax=Arctium lappa TaxID=4217 RepID=A0ACB9EI54_ARCLA|nr:hypothetical protein L6452_05694 [Arctium lappa]